MTDPKTDLRDYLLAQDKLLEFVHERTEQQSIKQATFQNFRSWLAWAIEKRQRTNSYLLPFKAIDIMHIRDWYIATDEDLRPAYITHVASQYNTNRDVIKMMVWAEDNRRRK